MVNPSEKFSGPGFPHNFTENYRQDLKMGWVLFFFVPPSLGLFTGGGGGGVYPAREPIVNFLISPDFRRKKFSGPRRGGGGGKVA
jgi:hypothetical protein